MERDMRRRFKLPYGCEYEVTDPGLSVFLFQYAWFFRASNKTFWLAMLEM
jgi:hypothetical protein